MPWPRLLADADAASGPVVTEIFHVSSRSSRRALKLFYILILLSTIEHLLSFTGHPPLFFLPRRKDIELICNPT
jgi:hypothetical protein